MYIPVYNTAATSHYAAIPIQDDPLTHQVNNIEAPRISGTLRIQVTIQGHSVQALVDTGASISAIRSSVAQLLGLTPDESQITTFTNADNRSAVSSGTVSVNVMLGDIHAILRCHVVDNLYYQVILGYPDLKALKAVIDTSSNEVRILKPSILAISGVSGSGSPGSGISVSGLSGSGILGSGVSESVITPAICSLVSSVRPPGQHHAYVDIQGPPNSAAFISTSPEMTYEKLLPVAAGIVNFDAHGIATVKIANLNKQTKFLNKGQNVATYQYLSPSFCLYPLQPESSLNSIISARSSTSSGSNLDFSAHIGNHLSSSERAALHDLLQEFPDCSL